MLRHIVRIDEPTIDQLFDVYAESMADLSASFADAGEMRASYREFLYVLRKFLMRIIWVSIPQPSPR